MIERVFILRSRLGRSVFALREDTLEITSYLFGRKQESVVPLRTISADYEVRGMRALRTVIVMLVLVGVCIVAYRWLLHLPTVPDMVRNYAVYFGAVFAWGAFKFYPRFEVFVFKNHFGRPLFTILRERGQKQECEAFLHALLDRLEALEADAPAPATPRSVLPDLEPANGDSADIPRWKLAIGFSLVSSLVPLVVHRFWPQWDSELLPLVLLCSGGAVISSIYSFAQKEPRRWWCCAAVVLAAIPVFFY